MLRKIPFLLFAVSFLGLACSEESGLSIKLSDLELVDFVQGYQFKEVSFSDGSTMPYVLHAPIVTSVSKLPLIIVLHGTIPQGKYKGEIFLKFLAVPGLSTMNAIFVAPTLLAPHWTYPEALEMIKSFVDGAKRAEWPVDFEKIVVLGYSNGGMGVWAMTGSDPDLFAAGIPMAAEPVIGSLKGTAIVPKYVIHSRADEVFSFTEVERDVNAEIQKGAPIVFSPVDNFSHSAISNYVTALKEAEPWLRTVLSGSAKSN
ncbi:MAG: hypothetical protein O3B41_04250 [Bacteroidetes bacterium]|nr:hypothetical protein [Bacteroidota bacterium]